MRELTKLYRMYQEYAIPLMLLPLALAAMLLGIYPAGKRVYAMYQEAGVIEEEVAVLKKKLSLLQGFDEQTLLDQLKLTVSAIPTTKSLATILSTVDTVGTNTGVDVTELSLASPGTLATESAALQTNQTVFGAYVIPFTIRVTGELPQLLDFFDTLVNVRRFVRVRSLQLSFNDVYPVVQIQMDTLHTPLPHVMGGTSQSIVPFSAEEESLVRTIGEMPDFGDIVLQTEDAPNTTGFKQNPFSLY